VVWREEEYMRWCGGKRERYRMVNVRSMENKMEYRMVFISKRRIR
jgi:hypothetical protein